MAESRSPEPAPSGADPRLAHAAEVIRLESRTIAGLEGLLGPSFLEAVERILACKGSVIVTGMGKAGLVGAKISATLASTGTPSITLHPGEALHGDLGRIRAQDQVLALSNSGNTAELKALLPRARLIGAGIIGMTGRTDSALAQLSDCVLDIGRVDEACPLGLAPTASTSAMLALGDALAMVVLRERGFSREDYALFHPSGSLGRRLMRVGEVMRQGKELPLVGPEAKVHEVLLTMTETPGRPGAAMVVDDEGILLGIFTDGDLRRLLEQGALQNLDQTIESFMGRDPKALSADLLLEDAERMIREFRVDMMPVVDEGRRVVGLLDVQDLLDTRLG